MKKQLCCLAAVLLCITARSQWQSSANDIINTNTGNVGIGLGSGNSPISRLHVSGNILATNYPTSWSGFTQIWADNAIIWKFGNLNNDYVGGLRFGTATDASAGNWSEKMRITDAGYLGLGVKTPSVMVDINSPDNDLGFSRIRLANTTSSGNTAGGSYPAIEVLGARGDGNATFEGRLALGTRRTDGVPLSNQTLGAVLFGGQYGTDMTFQSNKILYPSSIQGIAEGSFSSATAMPTGIAFFTGTTGNDVGKGNFSYGTERMRITSIGGVAIGTTSTQGYLLAVNGSAIFTKVVVKTYTNWPDFVFRKDYQLPTLTSVAAYIKANGHLSGVPTADSVEKNGLDVANTQAALLKKIEELTLYTIEQDKELKVQRERIDRLEQLLLQQKKD